MASTSENDEAPKHKKARKGQKPLIKSKTGCRGCKQRKIKCDERKPLCLACEKRYPGLEACIWDAVIYSSTPQNNSTPYQELPQHSTAPITQSLAISRGLSPGQIPITRQRDTRLLELQLFHQWTSSTCESIKQWATRYPIGDWLDLTPIWAFQHDFVLEFVLSFAALHLYCIDPIGNASFKNAVHRYTGQANQLHRLALENVTADNARQLFLAAAWTNLFGRAKSRLREPGEPYRLPIEIFHYNRGLITTYRAIEPFVPAVELEAIRNLNAESMVYGDGVDLDSIEFLSLEEKDDVVKMLGYITQRASNDEESAMILKKALSIIVSIQFGHRVLEPEERTIRRLNIMPAVVPPEFVPLLEAEDPLALAILARYFMLFQGRKEWFNEGAARTEVEGINELMPERWKLLMEYPLKIVTRT